MQHRKARHTGLVAAPSAALYGAALSIGFVPGAAADELPEQSSVKASARESAGAGADVAVTASESRQGNRGETGAHVSAQVRADQAGVVSNDTHEADENETDLGTTPVTPTNSGAQGSGNGHADKE